MSSRGTDNNETERRQAEDGLQRIEWLLTKSSSPQELEYKPSYGNLVDLNTRRLLADMVGEEILTGIVQDYLDLLDTSAAVYEKNGDYVLGIFTSGWCRCLDLASRKLCNTDDNRKALESGKWLCHESCWTKASKVSIETGKPVDIECNGGIHLYAVPIHAGGEIVGSINFGYGDPPRDLSALKEIAQKYEFSLEEIQTQANLYDSRPSFIIDIAKKRLQSSAKLIGTIVEQKLAEKELIKYREHLEEIVKERTAELLKEINEHKWAEEALKESEERLDLALESGHMGVWELDLIHDTAWRSLRHDRIFGYESLLPEWGQAIFLRHVVLEDRDRVRHCFEEALRTDKLFFECRITRSDQVGRWILTRGQVYRDEKARSVRMLGIVMDITERKQAEEARVKAEGQVRRALDNMLEGCMIIGFDWTYLYVNDVAARHGHQKRENLIGRTMLEIYPGVEKSSVFAAYRHCMEERVHQRFESEYTFADGTTDWYEFSVEPVPEGIFVLSLDITERKRTEESRSRLSSIVEFSDEAIFSKTLDGIILSWNPGAEKIYGYSAEEIIGKPISILIPQSCPDEMPNILEKIKQGETIKHYEAVRIRKDSTKIDVSITVSPIKDTSGRIIGVSTIACDITERKRIEEKLHEASLYTRSLIEVSLDPLVTISKEGKITDVNKATELVTGVPREKLITSDFSDYFTEPEKAREGYRQVFMKGFVRDYPLAIRHSSGKVTDVLYNAAVYGNKAGEIQGVFAAARDITERKQIEKERDRLFNLSIDMMCIAGFDGYFKQLNPAWKKTLGWTNEELMSKPFIEFVHPDDRESTSNAASILSEGKIVYTFDNRYLCKDGSYKWISWNSYPQVDEKLIFAVARDITERKQAEEALTKSETKYRVIFEDAGDYILVISLRDVNRPVIIDANNAALLHHGYSREELIGKAIWELDAPGYFKKNIKIVNQMTKPGDSCFLETVHIRKDGSTFPAEVSARLLKIGNEPPFLISIERDITERKRAEEKLLEASLYTRSLIEISLDPLVTISREGKITDVNKATELVTGFSRENLIGTDFSDYFTEPEKARKGYQWVFEKGFVKDYSLAICHVSGKITDVLYNASVYKDAAGNVIGVFAAARDVTERKRAEEKLAQLVEELSRTNQDLEQFIHAGFHDLQEPLRMVACYVQMLEKRYKGKLDPDADEIIGYAAEGAQRMSKMLNDLLIYTNLDKQARPPAPTDCTTVLEMAISNLKGVITESDAKITYDPMPSGVLADDTQLVRVFQNLLDNAIKFRSATPPHIQIAAVKKGSEWVFSISDNGIGIEPQYFDRIFLMFHRLHTRKEYPGTGVGLATCKKIVERHGGRIWVESRPGEGSTFYFTIPIKEGGRL